MSFILDALKKSETERQHQGSAEFVNVPTSGERREGPPAWLWVLGALLLINLVVLAAIMLRPEARPTAPDVEPASVVAAPVLQPAASTPEAAREPAPELAPEPAPEPVQVTEDFAARVAAAREVALPREEPVAVDAEGPSAAEPSEGAPSGPSQIAANTAPTTTATNTALLPTIHEVVTDGRVSVGELHVDIHVFAENRADRFVFINMAKYNEGARLAEGPLVEEITVDGVVLRHDGTTFFLPRD